MKKELRVKLLAHTPDPVSVLYRAYRQCYNPGWAGDVDLPNKEGMEAFVAKMRLSPHVSPLAHVTFTFAVEGISRACSHQLVRHRIASFSQQSQRYVEAAQLDYIKPDSIAQDTEANEDFNQVLDLVSKVYQKLLDRGIPAEDARFVLPNATETKIVLTMNCSALLHFFSLRCCERAQWEIRDMADHMLAECQTVLPSVFEGAGAGCEKHGVCFETPAMSCGRYQTITSLTEQ